MSKPEEVIYSVQSIDQIVIHRTHPPTLHMSATGTVRSSGWSNGRLVPRVYVTPPADGIMEFDFVAIPPDGVVLWWMAPITAPISGEIVPTWARGFRLVAETNEIEHLLPVLSDPIAEAVELSEPEALKAAQDDMESILIEETEGEMLPLIEGLSCSDFVLASLNIPETKTEWEVRCVAKNPFNGKCIAKTKVPIIYRRTSKLRLIAQVCYPDGSSVIDHVEDCVKQAVLAGVAVGVLTSGNLAVAAAALKTYLIACLKSKLSDVIGDVSVNLRREKQAGQWQKL